MFGWKDTFGCLIGLCLAVSAGFGQGLVSVQTPPTGTTAATRPNILLVIIDDWGRDKLAAYEIGDDDTRPFTPVMDELVARGVLFERFYTNPVCSPTRAQMLTGRHGFRNGVQNVVRPFQDEPGLAFSEVILPELLRPGGYANSQVGKWHLGSTVSGGPAHAILSGWDETIGMEGNPGPRDSDYFNWPSQEDGVVTARSGYLTTATTDDAIERAKRMPEPWHLWLSYNAGHGPWHVPPQDLHDRDPNELLGDDARMYQAMIEAVDRELGRLLDSLSPEVRARTTVILAGDNGTPSEATVPPLDRRRAKGTMFEAGIHVPLVISGFSVPIAQRGTRTEALASSVDVFHTILDIARIAPPTDRPLDGVSLLPVVRGNPEAPRRFAFAERVGGAEQQDLYETMFTDGRYKLIRSRLTVLGVPVVVENFYDLLVAPRGLDGRDLCPCPDDLDAAQTRRYRVLSRNLNRLLDN